MPEPEQQPEQEPKPEPKPPVQPEALSPEALRRLRERLVRKYH
jgi:hypothetical protein